MVHAMAECWGGPLDGRVCLRWQSVGSSHLGGKYRDEVRHGRPAYVWAKD